MLNINVLYIYPEIIEVNKEINLFRIIDNNIKETIIVFCIKKESKYEINLTNTLTGQVIYICKANTLEELDKVIIKFKEIEGDFSMLNNLQEIEKYILKLFKK